MAVIDDAKRSARQHDAMAAAYAADNTHSAYNAYYERPATIELLRDVEGLRVLEAAVARVSSSPGWPATALR